MFDSIRGVGRSSLWRAWKAIRGELRKSSVRDVVDFLEYDIDPDKWINTLLRDLRSERYEPQTPIRFSEAKGGGFSRRMTMPMIPDLVLYRTVVDSLYTKAKRLEQDQVFCERARLPPAIKKARAAGKLPGVWKRMQDAVTDYETSSTKSSRAWLIYNQYRRWLVFRKVHKFIVTTDITNFFDSVLYSRIVDSLQRIPAPPRVIGLLFYLLERLSIRDAYTESPRIGLPVDEFSCSRKLAHMVLFPHDERMVEHVGGDAYVRWMDDQNFGAASRAEALRCLAKVGESLGRLHLTPNSKKSRVLSIAEARRHFHFDLNNALDDANDMAVVTPKQRKKLGAALRSIIGKAKPHQGTGEWDKILKRLYRLAARAGSRSMRATAIKNALAMPRVTRSIADYMRCTGTASEYLTFVQALWSHPEQVYADVTATLFESLLRVEPTSSGANAIRGIASRTLDGTLTVEGIERCRSVAPLLILRFGDRRSLPLLRSRFVGSADPEVSRACAIVHAGFGPSAAAEVRKAASKLLRNHMAEIVKMFDVIEGYSNLPERWALRVKPAFDSVRGTVHVDMRGLTAIRLLGLNAKKSVRAWLRDKRTWLLTQPLSSFDRDLLARLWPG